MTRFNRLFCLFCSWIIVLSAAPARAGSMALTVVDAATKKPLPGAEVTVRGNTGQKKLVTDEQGTTRFDFQNTGQFYLFVSAKVDKYVPMSIEWRGNANGSVAQVPQEFTLELPAGIAIGGIVQDEAGQPVSGATVFVLLPNNGNSNGGAPHAALWDYPCLTDAKGVWHCDLVPADLSEIWLRLSHPDFVSDAQYGATPAPPIAELRKMTGVMVLKKGITVTGRVVDQDGKPIARASIIQGNDRNGSHLPHETTGADGQFTFKNSKPGDTVLTVEAKNHSPELKEIPVVADMKPLEIKLGEPHLLHGMIIDKDGNPLAGASINVDTWRGHRTLNWDAVTTGDGRFIWDGAPADEVLCNIYKGGFRQLMWYKVKPGDDAVMITLGPPLKVSGVVTDAETGKPVTKFTATPGIKWGPNQPTSWERQHMAQINNEHGDFQTKFDEAREGHAVRIEADGYEPAESRVIKDDETDPKLEFKLKKGVTITAIVRTADGKPAVNAEVAMVIPGQNIQISNGSFPDWIRQNGMVNKTDQNGRFSFSPQAGKFKVAVVDATGYAEAGSANLSQEIVLKPWGKIAGQLKIGSKPAASMSVRGGYADFGYTPDEPYISIGMSASTDSDGRFAMERVPPGSIALGRVVQLSENSIAYTSSTSVIVEPGKTATVTIGGRGRPLIGKLIIPDAIKAVSWKITQLGLTTAGEGPKTPENFKTMTDEQRKQWIEQWRKSPEGNAYLESMKHQRNYVPELKPDGSFRIEDVEPGTYTLIFGINSPGANNLPWGEEIARTTKTVIVAEIPGGKSDEPMDLGAVTAEVTKSK